MEAEIDSAAAYLQLDLSLFVYDVFKITHKPTSSQIKMIKCEILDPRIQLTDKEVQAFNSNFCKGTDPQDIGLLVEDASYGLKVRSKREKLSADQANLIKVLSQDLEIKTKYI